MGTEDPNEQGRGDLEARRSELEERGGEYFVGEDCPPEAESDFLESMRLFEEGPFASYLDRLLRHRGFVPPSPGALTDEELPGAITRLVGELAALDIYLTSTDHLGDRELYTHLMEDVLLELNPDFGVGSGWRHHLDILGGCSEEDIDLHLKYYADDEDRARWAAQFPDPPIPEKAPKPHDRDRFFPQAPWRERMMNTQPIIERMDRFSSVLPSLVSGLSRDESLWRPDEKTWSILEVVCHLADEEVGDFRPRLERTLAEPQVEWDGIDPEGWAVSRRYREADLDEATARFVAERRRSVMWLMGLGKVDWSRAHVHPRFGAIRAGDLLGAWAAHDALHLRQIAKRLHRLAGRDAAGFETGYAGEWGA